MPDTHAPRILIVDDEHAVVITYQIILNGAGYEAVAAETCAKGLQLLRDMEFDLLVCDLSLDGTNSGLDVIKAALSKRPEMPAILMTGYSDTELPSDLAHARVRLMVKPIAVADLLGTVDSLVRSDTSTNSASDNAAD
jgi:DNA-binding NtrC family response regulator